MKTPKKSLAAAVIGLGHGMAHVQAYRRLPGVTLRAVCDADVTRLAECVRELRVEGKTDYRDIIKRSDIDVVSICTPDHLHAEQCLAALEAGKHVLCEKPMTTTLDDARKLVAKVKETGKKLLVGNVNRFVPQFGLVKKMAEDGRLGELFHLEADYIHDMRGVYEQTPWRADADQPQDMFVGGGVHPVDLLRWVGGEVEEVTAYANKKCVPDFPLDDNYIAILKFKSGATGKVWVTAGIRRRPEHVVTLRAYGEGGTIETSTEEWEARVCLAPYEGQSGFLCYPVVTTVGHPTDAEIAHFLACVRGEEVPVVDAVSGARTVAVLEAAVEAARIGKPVKVAEL